MHFLNNRLFHASVEGAQVPPIRQRPNDIPRNPHPNRSTPLSSTPHNNLYLHHSILQQKPNHNRKGHLLHLQPDHLCPHLQSPLVFPALPLVSRLHWIPLLLVFMISRCTERPQMQSRLVSCAPVHSVSKSVTRSIPSNASQSKVMMAKSGHLLNEPNDPGKTLALSWGHSVGLRGGSDLRVFQFSYLFQRVFFSSPVYLLLLRLAQGGATD